MKLRNFLRAAAVALPLSGQSVHAQESPTNRQAPIAKAESVTELEKLRGQAWLPGLHIMQRHLESQDNELATHCTFTVDKMGNCVWQRPDIGKQNKVRRSFDARAEVQQGIHSGQYVKVCLVHTHPRALSYLCPPTYGDIARANEDAAFFRSESQAMVTMVVDASGIWYYRPATKDDYTKHPEIPQRYAVFETMAKKFFAVLYRAKQSLSDDDAQTFVESHSEAIAHAQDGIKERTRMGATLPLDLSVDGSVAHTQQDLVIILAEAGDPDALALLFPDQVSASIAREYLHAKQHILNYLQDYDKAMRAFATLPTDQKPTQEMFETLASAHLGVRGVARYVPNSAVDSEPPCAGVDWHR